MLWFAIPFIIYVVISIIFGTTMVGMTYKPSLNTQIAIIALGFLWPLMILYFILITLFGKE